MSTLNISNLEKSYGETKVVHGIDLDILDKEFVVLVGPSGCGKSTTLRMIAGLEDISGGELSINNKIVNELSPSDRGVAMVFQDYALYPHMTVFDNMAFGLKLKKLSAEEINSRINHAAEMLDLGNYLQRKPAELSGGQRQRVAMGRAVVKKADVFLFDEPLSNLDAKLRSKMRSEIKRFHRDNQSTIVYVTHDQLEAMTLAERLVVMKDGNIEQVGSPIDVFNKPESTFVAEFIGSPQMNLFNLKINNENSKNSKITLSTSDLSIKLTLPEKKSELFSNYQADHVIFGIRPSDIFIVEEDDENFQGWIIPAEVTLVEALGKNAFVTFKIGEKEWLGEVEGRSIPTVGDKVYIGMNLHHCHCFDTNTERNLEFN
jgi:multiple sugar transport system ATP-binding protein